MSQPTREQVRGLRNLALAVPARRAVAEVLRERVNAIKQAFLDATVYTNKYTGERVTIPDAANLPEGHCPALVAENALCQAEHALIVASAPLFGVTEQSINSKLDLRKEWVKNVVGLALAA